MEDQDALFVVKSRFRLTEEALAAALARAEKAERRVAELEGQNQMLEDAYQDSEDECSELKVRIAELEAAQDWRPRPLPPPPEAGD